MTPPIAIPSINKLFILCPQSIRDAYPSIDEEYFEEINSKLYLKLWVGKGKYTQTIDTEDTAYLDTIAGEIAPITKGRFGFEAVIDEPDLNLFNLVQHLRKNCLSSTKQTHTPIEILDFVLPQWDDQQSHNDAPYTLRTGRIISIQPQGASVGIGSALYGEGFTIRFKEKIQRILG